MIHAKFCRNPPTGSGEEDFEGFVPIWAWRPSWSNDQILQTIYISPVPRRFHINMTFIGPMVIEKAKLLISIFK